MPQRADMCGGSTRGACASDSSGGGCACRVYDDGTADESCLDQARSVEEVSAAQSILFNESIHLPPRATDGLRHARDVTVMLLKDADELIA